MRLCFHNTKSLSVEHAHMEAEKANIPHHSHLATQGDFVLDLDTACTTFNELHLSQREIKPIATERLFHAQILIE